MNSTSLVAILGVHVYGAFTPGLNSSNHSRQSSPSDDPSLCKLAAVPNVYLSEGFSDGATADQLATSRGTPHASMIFVDFPDAPANDSTQDLHDMFLPGAPEWYRTASYGALELDVVAPQMSFYRMPAHSDSYGWQRGFMAETHAKYINDALASVGTNISFDGIEVLYIVPTTAAVAINFSPTYQSPVTAEDGSSILRTVTFGQDVPITWGYKTMNHETGHAMGLPDLYPFDGTDTTRWTGGFDLMSLIAGVAPDYTAWHKWKLGWLADERIICVASASMESRAYTLSPLEVSEGEGSKALVIAHNETAALVAEARTTKANDDSVCAEGVLIYAVYADVETGKGPIRVFDSRPASGGCDGDELNDAPYDNTTFDSAEFGISIAVGTRNGDGWDVTVSKTYARPTNSSTAALGTGTANTSTSGAGTPTTETPSAASPSPESSGVRMSWTNLLAATSIAVIAALVTTWV